MNDVPGPDGAARHVRRLHRVLVSGVTVIVLILGGMVFVQGPFFEAGGIIGLVVAAVPAAIIALAVPALRHGIPMRRRDQSPDAFWSEETTRARALILWVVVEGAAMFGAVGYLLTANLVAGAVAGLALGVLFWLRPARLEEPGAA